MVKQDMYRVTQELWIPANSPRHAARIAKGLQRMQDNGINGEMPMRFTVEETKPFGGLFQVDLRQAEGEPEYCVQVR